MTLFSIHHFLEKVIGRVEQHFLVKDALAKAIKEATGFSLKSRNISVKGNLAYIEASVALRSEIFLKKEAILKKNKEVMPSSPIIDVW